MSITFGEREELVSAEKKSVAKSQTNSVVSVPRKYADPEYEVWIVVVKKKVKKNG